MVCWTLMVDFKPPTTSGLKLGAGERLLHGWLLRLLEALICFFKSKSVQKRGYSCFRNKVEHQKCLEIAHSEMERASRQIIDFILQVLYSLVLSNGWKVVK